MKRVAWYKRELFEGGRLIITGYCSICKAFPCEHVTTQGIILKGESCKK